MPHPSFSFDKDSDGRPLALVKGDGPFAGSVLYLHMDETGGKKGKRPKPTFNRMKYNDLLPKMKPVDKTRVFARIEEALADDKPATFFDSEPVIKEVYERILQDCSKTTSIELDGGDQFELIPDPDPKKREVIYITGQSGSGKSYIAKGYAAYYHKLFPDRGIYLISKLKEDETLDALKFIKRVNIQSLVDDPPDISEFNDCLVIFDDYDALKGDQEKAVQTLMEDICVTGRHTVTSALLLSHHLSNYRKTRLILNEVQRMVVYPQSTAAKALRHLLENHAGVDPDDLKRHKKWGSRWLCYFKGFPSMVIGSQNAEILNVKD